jgi:hypothetical protein
VESDFMVWYGKWFLNPTLRKSGEGWGTHGVVTRR